MNTDTKHTCQAHMRTCAHSLCTVGPRVKHCMSGNSCLPHRYKIAPYTHHVRARTHARTRTHTRTQTHTHTHTHTHTQTSQLVALYREAAELAAVKAPEPPPGADPDAHPAPGTAADDLIGGWAPCVRRPGSFVFAALATSVSWRA
jgi:hypothetical protein